MAPSSRFQHLFLWIGLIAVPGLATAPVAAEGETFIWTQTATGGLWSDTGNWLGGVAASGDGNTADFSTLDIVGVNTVHLDTPVTIGNLMFADVVNAPYGETGRWVLDNNGDPANILTLAGTTPTVTVGPTPWKWTDASINTVIAGTSGLTKDGPGILILEGSTANTYTGATTINGPLGADNPTGQFSTLILSFNNMSSPVDI